MKTTRIFSEMLKGMQSGARYIDSCGGTRSGKTIAALQLLIVLAMYDKHPGINSVVSESIPHLKRGAIRDFQAIMETEGLWVRDRWHDGDKIYTFPNGSIIEFFSADAPAKVHGPSRKRLFVNEAQNIDYETARQLFIRTTGQIMIDYNPTHEFWVNTKIQGGGREYTVHSTYKDNPFLSPEQVAEIESNRNDAAWWRVYGEGLTGTLDGLIYDFTLVDSMPSGTGWEELQGLDFGFTNDPTARVRVLADRRRKEAYLQERCYRTRMVNADVATDMRADGVGRFVPVYADCAEPKSIEEIKAEGFNIMRCDKDAPVKSDKLKFQINWMKGWKFFVTKDSLNLIHELRNYCWAKDRDGKPLNYPIDKFNHLLDAARYALWTRYGRDWGSGQYNISIR